MRVVKFALLAATLATVASAQTTSIINSSPITDPSISLPLNGQVCFTPVNKGSMMFTQVCRDVLNGNIQTTLKGSSVGNLVVNDTIGNPSGVQYYNVYFQNINGMVVRSDALVQPTGTTFDYSGYSPTAANPQVNTRGDVNNVVQPTGTAAPVGPAGGKLSGTYPNPGVNLAASDIPNIAESQVTSLTTDLAAKVATSTTVNGHALSSNVTVSASDITTGTLPHTQLPTLLSGDIPNNAANTTGTAGGLSANIPESRVTNLVSDLASKTITVASGSQALGTSTINSGQCATAFAISAPGVVAGDDVSVDFNANPTAKVGYGVSANGILTIYKWPSTDTVNIQVCNSTGLAINPDAATVNYHVYR